MKQKGIKVYSKKTAQLV